MGKSTSLRDLCSKGAEKQANGTFPGTVFLTQWGNKFDGKKPFCLGEKCHNEKTTIIQVMARNGLAINM